MTAPLLDLQGVAVIRQGRRLLSAIDLRVEPGQHWALLGPNGAGKTTMLQLCGAWAHPYEGTVDVLGQRVGRTDLRQLRTSIGHVDPRHVVRGPLTAREVVLTGRTGTTELRYYWTPGTEDLAAAEAALADLGLAHRADDRFTTLSQGERTRCLVARALVADPPLLLLDEPATGMDVSGREHLVAALDGLSAARPELASVMVTHHLEELPTTTSHALLLRRGEAVAVGPVDQVLTSDPVSRTFGLALEVTRTRGRWHAVAR